MPVLHTAQSTPEDGIPARSALRLEGYAATPLVNRHICALFGDPVPLDCAHETERSKCQYDIPPRLQSLHLKRKEVIYR